jgi:hypothetical protein
VPAGIVGRLELLDRHVFRAVLIPLGHARRDLHIHVQQLGEWGGGLLGARHRARVDRVDAFGLEVSREVARLLVTLRGEFGIRRTFGELASYRQGVADDQQFHCEIDKQI